jgi:hypothetical protein
MSLNVEKVMHQVRREIGRRGGLVATDECMDNLVDGSFPRWTPAAPAVRLQSASRCCVVVRIPTA